MDLRFKAKEFLDNLKLTLHWCIVDSFMMLFQRGGEETKSNRENHNNENIKNTLNSSNGIEYQFFPSGHFGRNNICNHIQIDWQRISLCGFQAGIYFFAIKIMGGVPVFAFHTLFWITFLLNFRETLERYSNQANKTCCCSWINLLFIDLLESQKMTSTNILYHHWLRSPLQEEALFWISFQLKWIDILSAKRIKY